jgi:hypothetical protein
MFKLFKKDPGRKLRKQYHAKLQQAMTAQRNGKIREYSFLTAEAETIRERLEIVSSMSTANH